MEILQRDSEMRTPEGLSKLPAPIHKEVTAAKNIYFSAHVGYSSKSETSFDVYATAEFRK